MGTNGHEWVEWSVASGQLSVVALWAFLYKGWRTMFVRTRVERCGGRCWERRELAAELFFAGGGCGVMGVRTDAM